LIEERKCVSLPCSPAKRVSPAKKKQFYINQAIRNSDLTPRAKGKKSLRRQENSKLYCPWNDFMNCSGEEQDRLLSLLEHEGAKRKNANQLLKDHRNGEPLRLFISLFISRLFALRHAIVWLTGTHLSTVYPAFTAQECFHRIDRRLRATLRRKQIPMVGVVSLSRLPLC
ncbi:hypothetical protein GOODEAATRI_005433, partial [Goodea atripinnis]